MKHRLATFGLVAGALVAGGTAGALIGIPAVSGAQTNTTPSSSSTTDTSNKDAAHEAAETPQHAADEASGKFQGGGGKSNTDPAHEAGESAARTAEEATHDATVTTTTP